MCVYIVTKDKKEIGKITGSSQNDSKLPDCIRISGTWDSGPIDHTKDNGLEIFIIKKIAYNGTFTKKPMPQAIPSNSSCEILAQRV